MGHTSLIYFGSQGEKNKCHLLLVEYIAGILIFNLNMGQKFEGKQGEEGGLVQMLGDL